MSDAMKLRELEPVYLLWHGDPRSYRSADVACEEANGLMFLCPKCFVANGGPIGTHVIICWSPEVPQSISPSPGRWTMEGAGFDDLSLVAGSSSVLLLGGCNWHGYVRNGEVTDA